MPHKASSNRWQTSAPVPHCFTISSVTPRSASALDSAASSLCRLPLPLRLPPAPAPAALAKGRGWGHDQPWRALLEPQGLRPPTTPKPVPCPLTAPPNTTCPPQGLAHVDPTLENRSSSPVNGSASHKKKPAHSNVHSSPQARKGACSGCIVPGTECRSADVQQPLWPTHM